MTTSYPWYSREGVAHGYQWYLSHAYNTITWFTVLKYIPKEDNEWMLHFSHICTLLESLVYENKMTFMISKVEKEWNNSYELVAKTWIVCLWDVQWNLSYPNN